MKKVVDTRNARTEKYRKVLERIAADRVCPFCPSNFRYHTRPVLKRRGSWLATRNFNPYPGSRHHFLLVGKDHKEKLCELTLKDMGDILWLIAWIERKHNLKGGGIAMRFGNSRYNGATVSHIHCHLIVPKLEYREAGKGRRQRVARVVPFPIG